MSDGTPVHVLHLSTATDWRGGEQQVAYLCRELAGLGVEQTLMCPQDSPLGQKLAAAGIRVRTFRAGMALNMRLARQLSEAAREVGAGLVHAHDSHGHTAAVLANTLFRMRLPLVVSRRVDFPIHSGFSARFKYGHRSVCRILCVSDAIREITAAGLRDRSVLRTVRSGVDPDRFREPADGRLHQLLDLDPSVPLVGCVAALAPHKDLGTFLHTIALLRGTDSPVHGVLIGEGALRADLEAMSRDLGISTHVHFTGFRNDVPKLMRELHMFLITSRTEGLGTSILDAFASDVPVVATRAGGIPEIVHHGESGLLCPVGDAPCLAEAVRSILHSSDLREKLVSGGYEVLRKHSPKAVAIATLAEYQAVLTEEAVPS